jgi:hypothetical protein
MTERATPTTGSSENSMKKKALHPASIGWNGIGWATKALLESWAAVCGDALQLHHFYEPSATRTELDGKERSEKYACFLMLTFLRVARNIASPCCDDEKLFFRPDDF